MVEVSFRISERRDLVNWSESGMLCIIGKVVKQLARKGLQMSFVMYLVHDLDRSSLKWTMKWFVNLSKILVYKLY